MCGHVITLKYYTIIYLLAGKYAVDIDRKNRY